jgi:hypothetical protein
MNSPTGSYNGSVWISRRGHSGELHRHNPITIAHGLAQLASRASNRRVVGMGMRPGEKEEGHSLHTRLPYKSTLPMVLSVEKAFHRRYRLGWLRQVNVAPAPSPPPPGLSCHTCQARVSWCSNRGSCCRSHGDGAHRQHSRTDLGVPARPATGVADRSREVRSAHPSTALLAHRHGSTRGAPGFHQTERAVPPLCSSVASVLVPA